MNISIDKSIHSAVNILFAMFTINSLVDGAALAAPCDLAQSTFCTFAPYNTGFWNSGETGTLISFQTLPNGDPSFGGASITPAFNYALQGATFSSAFPSLFISGNNQVGYGLTAYNGNIITHNSIIAQLTNPERGVGVFAIDHTTLFAFDAQNTLITSVSYNSFGTVYFLGIKSNIPIARVVIDNGTNSVDIDDFTIVHVPVPESASAASLLLAAPVVFRPRRRRSR